MKGEERPGGGADEFERRLRASLEGRSDRVDPSPYAYRSVLRRAERARRARVRRRIAVAGATAAVVGAVPVGVALLDDEPTQLVSSAAPASGLEPGEVPPGFELTEVVELGPNDTTPAGEDFIQVIEPVGRDGRIVARESSLLPSQLVPPVDATQVDVNGSPAWLARLDLDRASLTWADNQTQVVRELYSRDFSDAELLDVARNLRRRLDGPGFDVEALPAGLIAVDEGSMLAEEDPTAVGLRFSPVVPDGDGAIELSVRPGSALELEMLRVTAATPPLVVRRDDGESLLFSESATGVDVHRLIWSDGDAIVELVAEGLRPAELLDVAETLDDAGPEYWETLLAATPDGATIRGADDAEVDGVETAVDEAPGYAVEGVIDATAWRLSWPTDPAPGTCLTLTLGAPSLAHCLVDEAPGAVAFELGEVTALVVVAPGDAVTSVDVPTDSSPAAYAGVWAAWMPTDAVPEVATVELAGGGLVELTVSRPNQQDEVPGDEAPDDGGAR